MIIQWEMKLPFLSQQMYMYMYMTSSCRLVSQISSPGPASSVSFEFTGLLVLQASMFIFTWLSERIWGSIVIIKTEGDGIQLTRGQFEWKLSHLERSMFVWASSLYREMKVYEDFDWLGNVLQPYSLLDGIVIYGIFTIPVPVQSISSHTVILTLYWDMMRTSWWAHVLWEMCNSFYSQSI